MDILGKDYNNALKTFNSHTALEPFDFNNILVLPFHENFVKLVHVFKMYYNINLIFKNTSTLKNLLINNTPVNNNSCIFKIHCNDYDKVYIGQTGASLATRISHPKS